MRQIQIEQKTVSERDCLKESMSGTLGITFYSDVEWLTEYFKNNTKINPKVMEDVNAIRERLSCNYDVIQCMKIVVSKMHVARTVCMYLSNIIGQMITSIYAICFYFQMQQLVKYSQINITELNVCEIKNDKIKILISNDFDQVVHLIGTETALSKRVPDRAFPEIINLLRFSIADATVTEIENALVS